jgi:hypothetical protein
LAGIPARFCPSYKRRIPRRHQVGSGGVIFQIAKKHTNPLFGRYFCLNDIPDLRNILHLRN